MRDRYYDRKKSTSRLSGGCVMAITTGKKSSSRLSGRCAIISTTGKKSFSPLSGGLCSCVSFSVVAGKFYYNRKKSSSCLSGGLCCCVSFWFWRLRPEKKVLVVCLAGCVVVSVFGSGGK